MVRLLNSKRTWAYILALAKGVEKGVTGGGAGRAPGEHGVRGRGWEPLR